MTPWAVPEEPSKRKPKDVDPAEFDEVRRRQEQLAERVRIVEAQVRAMQERDDDNA